MNKDETQFQWRQAYTGGSNSTQCRIQCKLSNWDAHTLDESNYIWQVKFMEKHMWHKNKFSQRKSLCQNVKKALRKWTIDSKSIPLLWTAEVNGTTHFDVILWMSLPHTSGIILRTSMHIRKKLSEEREQTITYYQRTFNPRSPSPRIRSPSVTTMTSTFLSGQFLRISRTWPLQDHHQRDE